MGVGQLDPVPVNDGAGIQAVDEIAGRILDAVLDGDVDLVTDLSANLRPGDKRLPRAGRVGLGHCNALWIDELMVADDLAGADGLGAWGAWQNIRIAKVPIRRLNAEHITLKHDYSWKSGLKIRVSCVF